MSIEPLDQASSENSVLALFPPEVVDSNKSVVGADCGLAKNFYDLTPEGGKARVDPYLGQDTGDTVSLNLNGVPNIASTQTQSADSATTLYIPKNLLNAGPGVINELTYTVTRNSQNQGTSNPPLRILYNSIRPGIEDLTPGDGVHSELKLILPKDVLEDGIDADRAERGVHICFFYPYCRPFDKIRLNLNGHDVYRVVTADEAPPIPTVEPTTVCLTVGKSDFELAGDSPQFVFSFTVEDQIGNGADPDSPWSESWRVDVDLNGVRLTEPDITEDPDDPNDAPDTIDLNKLGAKDLTVQVHVLASVWKPDDKIRVKYTATPNAGGTPVEHAVEATVLRIPFVQKLMIPNAKVIANSVVKVSYEQVREEVVIARSKVATARVIRAPVITSAKNSAGTQLQNGGTVSDNKVILEGSALASTKVQIFNGQTFIEEVQSGTDYKWKSSGISIVVGMHTFTAREKDGTQLISEPWLIERLAFSIERTQMKLDGFSIKVPQWPKTGEDSLRNTGVRVPTGGVPPYDFASSEPLTVPVTAQGKVTGLKNGVATIYVTDQEGTSLTYLVAVTNVFKLLVSDELLTFTEAESWMYSVQGRTTYDYSFLADIARVYTVPLRPNYVWTCYLSGRFGILLGTGGGFAGTMEGWKLESWCLVPF